MIPLTVTDAMGAKTLTCAQAQDYHAARHGPGVALAWRFFELAYQALDLRAPAREAMAVDLSVTPPGLTDAVEFLTRAVSRRRIRVMPRQPTGATGCGDIVLGLTVGTARVRATVRPDVVPAGFPEAQTRDEAGFVPEDDQADLWARRAALTDAVSASALDDLFEVDVGPGAPAPSATPTGPTPVLRDPTPVIVRDLAGEHAMTMDHALAFHDGDHFGGVVLAHKLLRLAAGDRPLDRNGLVILTGLTPPGLLDTLEVGVRALTRQRLARLPSPPDAPPSPFGVFAFRILTGDRAETWRLKDGLLPDDFADMGRLSLAGLATPAQDARWAGYKRDVATAIVDLAPTDLLERVDP
ncbi:hypothetical protein [Roseospira visakhapatnamensis]|uniref:Uncharacterized protein n=1 Tax=Roseospira visakhapatnamensis TaxID=390880 RepID=A0A7W6RCX9_9PROT|nr:hypothetical protein [Roseospira visakhapatnamensis]MBB4265724.1 hypothetical protein [Roseospira visakhapatnamensis]